MSGTAWLNGEYLPRDRAMVPVDDRGFVFGDGVYEVLRSTAGRLFEPARHLARLGESLAAIRIAHERATPTRILEVVRELLERNGLAAADATAYVQVTRGVAPRRHAFPEAGTAPTVFVSVAPFSPRVRECTEGVAAITHPDVRWGRCDIKSINLLANVLANEAAHARGAYEAVLVRDDGTVTEATHSSVFGVVDDQLRTHPLGERVLPGVTRARVIELARELGLPLRERPLQLAEVARASELFLTGTTTDVMPIVTLDERPVGVGRPGRMSRMLYEALMRARETA